MKPQRIQLSRAKGWRKPEGAVVVSRPSKWGNPVPWRGDWILWTAVGLGYYGDANGRRAAAVAIYRSWMTGDPVVLGPEAGSTDGGTLEFDDGTQSSMGEHCMGIARFAVTLSTPPTLPERPSLVALRGHDLACWCPLEDASGARMPCHADVLLELANR